ncbi:KCNK18 (predicted) [Pycnogonum litorale]
MERKRSSKRSYYRYHPKPKRSQPSKCKECCRKFTAFMFSHVGVCVLVVGYSIMGAFAFKALEASTEEETVSEVQRMRQETVERLWQYGKKYRDLYWDNWTEDVRIELKHFQDKIVEAVKTGYDGNHEQGVQQWTFSGAFLYSLTVITTIGYGNIAPRTDWGKIVTMVYAIIGIPVMFLYLANIGGIFAAAFKYAYNRICSRRFTHSNYYRRRGKGTVAEDIAMEARKTHESGDVAIDGRDYIGDGSAPVIDDDLESRLELDQDEMKDLEMKPRESVPITLCLVILVTYISAGAALFSLWEGWDYLDGSYFCFVTLSTIGFGDLVPGASVVSDGGSQEKLVFCSLYLLVGLAVIAMCFNLMQEEVIHKVRSLGLRIGMIKDPDAN